mgnify:CR=1 FL=1
MKVFTKEGVICLVALTMSSVSHAQTSAQLNVGIASYKLDLTQGDISIEDDVPYGRFALSHGIASNIAISAYYVAWGEGSNSFEEQSTRPGLGNVSANRNFDFDRNEYSLALSFGLPLDNNALDEDDIIDRGRLSLVTGYRWSETNATSVTKGVTTGFDFDQKFEMNIEANGPYIGLSYHLPKLPIGLIGLSLAAGLMSFEATSFAEGQEGGTSFTIEGTSEDSFLSSVVGIKWSNNFEQIGYGLSAEYFNYEYDVLSEKSLALTASISTGF